ncbi:MAG: hypothetical protein PHN42_03965 [Bacilli bacterium]|nr:hypothetical protein [Bacilli bacterium]
MNVIIANKYQSMLETLEIDVIKKLEGEFEVEDIINQFQNFFFQRMILDITAIKDYRDIKTLQKLSISLDMDKVILLLDDSSEGTSNDYLSKLISMGIYNFTKNIEGIMYLYNNPNSYRDVAHIQQLDMTSGEEVIIEKYEQAVVGTRIIGIKNVTKQSGATTLSYMIKNQLKQNYSVVAIEVNKSDFRYFGDKSLISTTNFEIGNQISKYSDNDVIIVDINDSKQAEDLCHDVIYLVEPSIIKLNKLMLVNSGAFKDLAKRDAKVVLNQSLLNSKDVLDFEYESGAKVFYNMPPLDEREKSIFALNSFLVRLGFNKQKEEQQEKKKSLLSLFSK